MIGSARAKQRAVALAGVGISGVAILLLVRSIDLRVAWEVLLGAAPLPLAAGMVVLIASLLVRIVMWQILLPPARSGLRVPARRVAPVLFVGYLSNLLLPARLGEVIRAYLIDRRDDVPFGGALGSVALERILDITSLAVMAFAAASLVGADAWVVRGTAILSAVGVVAVLILATVGLQPVLGWIRRLGSFEPLRRPVDAVAARLELFVHWSGGAHRRRVLLAALGMSVVAWAGSMVMYWCIGIAVGVELSPAEATLVMATMVLATAIPSAPAYVGTYELAGVAVLGSLGVQAEAALAFAVIAHLMGLLPAAVGGALALVSMGSGLTTISDAAMERRDHATESASSPDQG